MTFPNGWDGPGYFASQLAPEKVRSDWAAPNRRPGIVPPRPLQLGDILGGTFRSVRFAPAVMFGIPAIAFLIAQLLSLSVATLLDRALARETSYDAIETMMAFATTTQIVGSFVNSLVGAVAAMALLPTVVAAVSGRRTTPNAAMRNLGRHFWAAIGYWLMCGLLLVAPNALSPLLTESPSALIGVLGVVALIGLVAVALLPRLLFAPCAIAIEGLGPVRAIRRGWQLSRGRYWPILGTYLLTSFLINLAAGTVAGVFTFVSMVFGMTNPAVLVVATTASQLLAAVLSVPLVNGLIGLLYVDTRIRNEGFDLELSEELYG